MRENFVVFRNLVSEPERLELCSYALGLQESRELKANPQGPNRYYQRIWGGPLVTPLIRDVAARIEHRFGLARSGITIDPDLGWVISVIFTGGFVNTHIDSRSYQHKPLKHLRCNLVASKPDSGGEPVISDRPVPLVEGGGWAFFASEYPHSSFPVGGTKPRIIYQFGFSVPEAWELRDSAA